MHTHCSDANQVAAAHSVHALYLKFDPTRDAVPDLPASESFGHSPVRPADAVVNWPWKTTYANLAQFTNNCAPRSNQDRGRQCVTNCSCNARLNSPSSHPLSPHFVSICLFQIPKTPPTRPWLMPVPHSTRVYAPSSGPLDSRGSNTVPPYSACSSSAARPRHAQDRKGCSSQIWGQMWGLALGVTLRGPVSAQSQGEHSPERRVSLRP